MPWLAGTALLHSAIIVEKRDTLKTWTILLAIVAFSLSLLGTFLVRSGVISSVHSFASDPGRGLFILGLLLATVGGSLGLYAVRAPVLKSGGLFSGVSREGSLVLNNVLLSTAAGTVLLGTLYPLFADALNLGKLSVGAPFFNAVLVPLSVPLVLVMALGPLLAWKRGNLLRALRILSPAAVIGLLTAGATLVFGGSSSPWWAALGTGLAAYLFVGTLAETGERARLFQVPLAESLSRLVHLPRSAYGLLLGHLGLALVVAGITGSSAWKVESIQTQRIGETVVVAGYGYRLDGVEETRGPNYVAARATVSVTKDGKPFTVMYPEKRLYMQPQRPTTEAAIETTLLGDLYAVVGDSENGAFVTRLYFNPLVPWLWAGGVLMALGGLVSLSDRRHRIGAPVRARGALPANAATGRA